MAIPDHVRVEFRGTFGDVNRTSQEEWSWSLRHADIPEYNDPGQMNPVAEAIVGRYQRWVSPIMPSNAVLRTVKISRITVRPPLRDATVVRTTPSGELVQGVHETAIPGDTGPINAPPQLAVCVSLITPRRGATGKGRLFLPMPGLVPSLLDRRLSAQDAGQIAGNMRNLVSDLNGLLGFGSVSVVSSKGFVSPVTEVKVGRTVDTIRSRRNRLPEDYVSVAV